MYEIIPKYALNIDKDTFRVLSATFSEYATADAIFIDTLPEGNIADYLYINNEYIYDPLSELETQQTEPTTEDILNVLLGVSE